MTFTDEQEALRETVRAVTERHAAPWKVLCDQVGVAGLAVPEAHGGLGAGLRELQVVAEELGRALVSAPFLGSVVLATQALLESGDHAAAARLLPRLAEGSVAALAWTPKNGAWDPDEVAFCANGPTLDGHAHYVLNGAGADVLLAVAETDQGIGLFELDPQHARIVPSTGMDETRDLAEFELVQTPATRIGTGDFRAGLRRVRDVACAVLAAEQAGAAARALDITVAYSKQREQFGRPIGGFQALKHRMADLHVLVETARSAAYAVSEPNVDVSRLAAVAKTYCSEAFSTVAAEMIQLHGGIAITWEHEAHRYFKRAHGTTHLFGQPHHHLSRITPTVM
ncbi:acyl-CoA/acyl-ACP dehydrogenase [Amycolatopsis acidiphila]|uniref:Acyl-CoA dehydrogenase n=1 Tax=Amycolatopsis acidiphila TaxID=715473 RepID=A0A558AEX7_9PSEU|nr:acyl-CoA dehydrogenase family protein [Amycolatopsis acidiphila]TVT22818.1 acyl-CoA dehydrogenase [Amycolatopsis acidiphila]UIJ58169.1 acyl-CoA/acyl-ACP dehydrogenase [Amycolatopsis acidiphila]GHG69662.1 acyl-CoA dehydrogenase [Amycolatopsis acidiphila]